jgi:hypothetical protein
MIAVTIRPGMNADIAMDIRSDTGSRRTERSIQIIFQTDTTPTVSAFTTGSMQDTIEVTGRGVAEDCTTTTAGNVPIQKAYSQVFTKRILGARQTFTSIRLRRDVGQFSWKYSRVLRAGPVGIVAEALRSESAHPRLTSFGHLCFHRPVQQVADVFVSAMNIGITRNNRALCDTARTWFVWVCQVN